MKYFLMFSVLICSHSLSFASTMTQETMEKIVSSKVEIVKQNKGFMLFKYNKINMALISDVKHDRMRIISAITDYPKINEKIKDKLMQSNFHSALDARYAVSRDVLYSAFIHPLSSLSKNELISALNQVASLAKTYGSTFSSGGLVFNNKAK